MATLIDKEPQPRNPVLPWAPPLPLLRRRYSFSKPEDRPHRSFFDVLRSRCSKRGTGALTEADVSCLIWHSMLLRERRGASECFLDWESRASPSAGGLHPIQLLLLPIDNSIPIGFYDPLRHEVVALEEDPASLIDANKASVERLCGAHAGTTLQFIADWTKVQAAYLNGESLLWRDSGALTTTIALVAEALWLTATPLGRTGKELLAMSGLTDARWRAVGAIHIQGFLSAE